MNRKYSTDTELLERICNRHNHRDHFVQLTKCGERFWYKLRCGYDTLEDIGEKDGPFWSWREALRAGLIKVDELLEELDGGEGNE